MAQTATKARISARPARRPKSTARMEAEWWPISKLRPDPKNVRVHDQSQIEMLRASVREFGQVWPILIRKDGTIIAHHGVLDALMQEGYTEAKVAVADGLTPAQIEAFAIADNRLALISDWDESALKAEIEALQEIGMDMSAMGFNASDLERLLKEEAAKFKELDENLETSHECPRCGFKWS